MLAGDKKNLAKTFRGEVSRFCDHLIDLERDAEDWVIAREAAVAAGIDALVRQIKRCEETHRPPEVLHCQTSRVLRHRLKLTVSLRREERLEARNGGAFLKRELVQDRSERHQANFASQAARAKKKTPGTHAVLPAFLFKLLALLRTRSSDQCGTARSRSCDRRAG